MLLLLFWSVLMVPSYLTAQTGPGIAFEIEEHNFGTVEMGTVVRYTFIYRNTGNQPLIASKAKAGCGCTKVEFTADTLAPGESGGVTYVFDTQNRLGNERNSLTLWTNAKETPHKLKFHGVIVPRQTQSEDAIER